MTDMMKNEKPSQYKIELVLPWHAAGALNSRDADEIEKALAQDKELARFFAIIREEMSETIRLNETLGGPSARAMDNLFKVIDKEPQGRAQQGVICKLVCLKNNNFVRRERSPGRLDWFYRHEKDARW